MMNTLCIVYWKHPLSVSCIGVILSSTYIYVAVSCRNRRLFRRVFRVHHWVRRAIALSFCLGRGSYVLRGCIRYSCIYIAHMSPTLNGSSALQRIKLSDTLEIRNGIIFDFYTGLPHIYIYMW